MARFLNNMRGKVYTPPRMTKQETITTTMHWPGGQICEITRKVDGKPHGRQQGWREDGQPEYDSNYERGKQHGSVREWNTKGVLIKDAWHEHGVRHGRQQGWHDDGQRWYDQNYERGKQHGRQQTWGSAGRGTTAITATARRTAGSTAGTRAAGRVTTAPTSTMSGTAVSGSGTRTAI